MNSIQQIDKNYIKCLHIYELIEKTAEELQENLSGQVELSKIDSKDTEIINICNCTKSKLDLIESIKEKALKIILED